MRYKDNDVLVYWGVSADIKTLKSTYPKQYYVLAPKDYDYLDCGMGNKYGEKTHCDPFKTWLRIYSFEPTDYVQGTQVLGGELAMWSEISGDLNIHAKTWPRSAALGEKYWSDNVDLDLVKLVDRMNGFTKSLTDRGIPSSPITGYYCEIHSDHCFAPYT